MTMAKLTFTRNKFEKLLSKGLENAAQKFSEEFQLTIQSPLFSWPNETNRKNGEKVFTPRNIVDLGAFLNSHSWNMQDSLTAYFEWDTEYSTYILEGYTTSSGGVYPSRDWIRTALNNNSFESILGQELRKVF